MTNSQLLTAAYPDPIFRGTSWHMEVGFRDTTDGDPFDWTTEPGRFSLRSDLRDKTGALLARFTEAGAGDEGTLVGDADGILSWDLPGSVTADLPLTRDYRNTADPRITTWRAYGSLFLDLVVTDTNPTPDESWLLMQTHVVVSSTVTEVP